MRSLQGISAPAHSQRLRADATLTQEPLCQPIVACRLGKLYNKEAIIAYLLAPTTSDYGADGHYVASHLRSLRDVTTLNLTPNPTLQSQSAQETESFSHIGTQESRPTSLFVDPISLKEMNGATRFVYRIPGGSVISESSLKEMRKAEGENVDTRVDPVTGLRDPEDASEEEYITINPREEEAETMRDAFEALKAQEKELKKLAKDKKRKANSSAAPAPTDEMLPPLIKKTKRIKTSLAPPLTGPTPANTIPLLSATLAAKIAAEKSKHSPAIASLYAPKGGDANHDSDGRSNWMTRSTFVRGSFS